MDKLIYQNSPRVTFATNHFLNVPIILQFDDTPLISIVREEALGYTTEIPIYHADGTYLAKVSPRRMCRSFFEAHRSSTIFTLNPQGDLHKMFVLKNATDAPPASAASYRINMGDYVLPPQGAIVIAPKVGNSLSSSSLRS